MPGAYQPWFPACISPFWARIGEHSFVHRIVLIHAGRIQPIASDWVQKVRQLPGEFEVFSRPARLGSRAGRLLFTNQRFIWRPSFKRKLEEIDYLIIPHQRVASCDVARPWQGLFLVRALRLRLKNGEAFHLMLRNPESVLAIVREYVSHDRYRPGELFKSEVN